LTRRPNTEQPNDRSQWSFGRLLGWHLRRGTRPGGKIDRPGKQWGIKEFAVAVGLGDRAIRYWLRNEHLPPEIETIERVVFGSEAFYSEWRLELRKAHGKGRYADGGEALAFVDAHLKQWWLTDKLPASSLSIQSPSRISAPAYVRLNEDQLRQIAIGSFSSDLVASPLAETKFVNFYDCVEEASNWLGGSGVVQTTSLEFKEVWLDPRYFPVYEASLITLLKKGLDVCRIFILNPEIQMSERRRKEFQKVIIRHDLLGLRPRVLVRPDALTVHKSIGIDCDSFTIIEMSAMFLVKIWSPWSMKIGDINTNEPIMLKTTNKSLCTKASNIFNYYWKEARTVEFLREQWGALTKEYVKIIEEEARQIERYCSFYVGRGRL
jgi:hypothetical protein